MAHLPRVALILLVALALAECGNYELQKQKLVRAVSAAVFQRVISVQQCIALDQSSVIEAAQAARTKTAAKRAVTSVRTCNRRKTDVMTTVKSWLMSTVRAAACTVR